MKARVPARQKLSKQMQASIQELVTKEREEQSKKLIEQILKVSLINLNRNFGFGQQRLIKFLDTVTEMFREHMHDELYWYHVDKILKEELKIDMEGLNELAKIPSREVLLSKLLGSLQSPITNFARVIKQIAEKDGEATTEAPAEEAAAEE